MSRNLRKDKLANWTLDCQFQNLEWETYNEFPEKDILKIFIQKVKE